MTESKSHDAQLIDQAAADQSAILDQFTQSLEEATFLRRLAKHFELRDVRHSVAEVAAEVLPELRQIVLAEAIGFVPTGFIESNGAEHADQPVWIGKLDGADMIQAVLAQCLGQPVDQPIVMNHRATVVTPLADHGINSLILVRVESSQMHVGWLIVLNRHFQDILTSSENALISNEIEFGSIEASLVQATAAMMATHARNVTLFEEKERLLIGVITAMSGAVDARDPYTHGHSRRVASYARVIAKEMGLSERECEEIYISGLLHDIGKIGVPDAVLQKDSALTDEEYEIIKRHPETGYQILLHLDDLAYVLPGVRHHHERQDGRGYPCGLIGSETALMAKILAVADSYDAMTSDRPYRNALSSAKAEAVLMEHSGTQWDEAVVDAFFRCRPTILQAAKDYAADPNQSLVSMMHGGTSGDAMNSNEPASSFASAPADNS